MIIFHLQLRELGLDYNLKLCNNTEQVLNQAGYDGIISNVFKKIFTLAIAIKILKLIEK